MELLIVQAVAYIGLPILLLWIHRWMPSMATGDGWKVQGDNPALAVRKAGLMAGTILASVAVSYNAVHGYMNEEGGLVSELLFSWLIILFSFFVARLINDKVLLPGIDNKGAIEKGNMSVAVVEMSSYITTGWIAYASIIGDGPLMSSLVFLVLGQATFVLTTLAYEKASKGQVLKEVYSGNVEAGLGVAAWIIPIGVVLALSIAGNFTGWMNDILSTASYFVAGLAMLMAFNFALKKIIKIQGVGLAGELTMLTVRMAFVLVVVGNLIV